MFAGKRLGPGPLQCRPGGVGGHLPVAPPHDAFPLACLPVEFGTKQAAVSAGPVRAIAGG